MLEKWKQRVIRMNLKKGVAILMTISVVLALASLLLTYFVLGSKEDVWNAMEEIAAEYNDGEVSFPAEGEPGFSGGMPGFMGGGFPGMMAMEGMSGNSPMSGVAVMEQMRLRVEEKLGISGLDIALMMVCSVIGMVLRVFWRLLIVVGVCRKAGRMKSKVAVWGFAALVFGFGVLVLLYLYDLMKGIGESGEFANRSDGSMEKSV